MRVSNNELLSLLTRAFEGAGWIDGRSEDAAASVWWLQAHGIDWLDRLPHCWPRLDQGMITKTKLIQVDSATSILDVGGSSLLHCGSNSIDIVYATACRHALAIMETRRCTDRTLILSGLTTLARRGANALARWYAKDRLHFATIDAGRLYPAYTQYQAPAPSDAGLRSLFLACSRQPEGLDHYHRTKHRLDKSYPMVDRYTPEQFERDAKLSLTNGIEVDQDSIAILNQAADRLLVGTGEHL